MRAIGGWFRHGGRQCFSWLHVPNSGTARIGVALCPPFGLEYLATHRTYRLFANQLADAGIAVLRFDWCGTGDSSGTLDDATVDGWLDDAGAAIAHLQSLGIERTALVGMRLGATLAASAVDRRLDVDGMVLWDPCRSGRTFLREQRALYALSGAAGVGAADDRADAPESTGVETLGFVYPEALTKELRGLDFAGLQMPPRVRTLLLTRGDRPQDKELAAWTTSDDVDQGEAADQAELLDVGPSEAKVPHATLDRITEWVTALAGERTFTVQAQLDPDVAIDADGVTIHERVTTVGPLGLFGIETEPDVVREGTPTVVFIPVAAEHRVGPGRMWVELARELATLGFRSLRFDLSGLGDSPTRPGQPEHWVYAPEALDDIDDVIDALSLASGDGAVLVGLCSGAHAAMRTVARSRGTRRGAPLAVQSVCALNPFLWYGGKAYLASEPYEPSPVMAPVKSWMRVHMKDRLRQFGDSLPESVWSTLSRTPLVPRPTEVPEAVVDVGVDLLLVLEHGDAHTIVSRFPSALKELEDTGRFRLEAPEGGDHSLFATRPREAVRRLVREHIEWVAGPPSRS